jgi:hypothetical protein
MDDVGLKFAHVPSEIQERLGQTRELSPMVDGNSPDTVALQKAVEIPAAARNLDLMTDRSLGASKIDRSMHMAVQALSMVEDVQDPHQKPFVI